MATVVVIAYSDQDTAEQARATAWQRSRAPGRSLRCALGVEVT